MKTSNDGKQDIKDYEGVRYVPYFDTGHVLTIGVGHTGPDVKIGMKATAEDVDRWLSEDLEEAEEGVNRLVKVPLTQGQFDALVSFTFNLGVGQFSQSTLLRLLNAKKYEGAAAEFQRWVFDDGKKQPGLVKRRLGERARFES